MRSSPSRAKGRSRVRNSITRSPTRTRRPCCECAPVRCARCAASWAVSPSITSASAISGWPRSSSVTSGRASSVPPGSPKRSPRIPNTRMRALLPRVARDRQAPEASMRRIAAICSLTLAFAARATDPEIKFEKYKLGNGLTVILSEDHRLPQVAVNVWYHVGAANQTPGRSGFAHLFEHMMFSGTKHAKDFDTILEQIGASGMNGSTSFDRTNYYETVPSNELPTALWLESDRVGFLLPTLDEQTLKLQRDVVSNERHQRIDNVPYGPTQQRVCDLLYPLPHPYFECPIGRIEEIQRASLDDVRDFFRRYYGPNNASLVLVWDFDPATAKRLIEKYFADIPRGPEVQKPDVKAPPISSVVQETLQDRLAQLPRFQMIWNGLKPFHDDEPAGDVLSEVLAGGKTSRLYQRLIR